MEALRLLRRCRSPMSQRLPFANPTYPVSLYSAIGYQALSCYDCHHDSSQCRSQDGVVTKSPSYSRRTLAVTAAVGLCINAWQHCPRPHAVRIDANAQSTDRHHSPRRYFLFLSKKPVIFFVALSKPTARLPPSCFAPCTPPPMALSAFCPSRAAPSPTCFAP